MPCRRAFIKVGLLATLARLMPPAAHAASYPFSQNCATEDEFFPARIFARECQIIGYMAAHTATVGTQIQITKFPPLVLAFPRRELHFVDRVDFSKLSGTMPKQKVERTGNIITRFRPLGFADRAFIDSNGFTQARYQIHLQGLQTALRPACWVYDVTPDPTAVHHGPGPFFKGTIWVETKEFTIIRFKGNYVPASHMDRALVVRNFFAVDAYRTEAGQHLWLPDRINSSNTAKNGDWIFPEFEAHTTFSDYKRNQPTFTKIPPINAAPNRHSADPISHCINQNSGS
jgi:hypothetical protein